MAKSVSIKSTKLSLAQSTRNISSHDESDYEPESSIQYSRISKSKSVIASTISIPPAPINKLGSMKCGYELKFEIPPKEFEEKDDEKHFKAIEHPPDHINLFAVNYSLDQKYYVTNSTSFYGDQFSSLNSKTSFNELAREKKETILYEGGLRYIGKVVKSYVTKPKDIQASASVFVNATSTDSSQGSLLWSWPWIDRSKGALDLYQCEKKERNCIDTKTDDFPKLPCPLQAHCLLRYLQSIKPCLPELYFKETQKLVEEFALTHGSKLHDIIFNLQVDKDNWAENILPRYDYCYAWGDTSLSNLAIVTPFCHDVWPEKHNSLLERSSLIVSLVTEFWQLIRTQRLKSIVDSKGQPLCMSQFYYLFNAVQIPGIPFAAPCTYLSTEDKNETPRHIIVIHRGRIFSMNVVNEDFESISPVEIKNCLKEILLFASKSTDHPVGILTSTDLDSWTSLRQHLIHLSESNASNLLQIEQAIFVLSLDHKSVNGFDRLANEAVFADGYNRWFEKSLNFYVHNNGLVTVNVNRALLDGSTVAYLLHYMHLRIIEEAEKWSDDEMLSISSDSSKESRHLTNAEQIQLEWHKLQDSTAKTHQGVRLNSLTNTEARALSFDVDDNILSQMKEIAHIFDRLSMTLVTATCKNDTIDSEFFSNNGIHMDAFAHMALHLTFFQMYFRITTIGCKVSIKKFRGTRCDILRSTTPQIAEWCKAMLNNDADESEQEQLFWKAEKFHRKLLCECYDGKGCDNYINALSLLAEDHSLSDGNMFDDDFSSEVACLGERFEISTEQLGAGCTGCPVVPPSVPTGYGVGYSVASSFLLFFVASWERESSTSADLFAASLHNTIQTMCKSVTNWNSKHRAFTSSSS